MVAKLNVVLFLGAGFSKSMDDSLPTGFDLLDRIVNNLKSDNSKEANLALSFIQSVFSHTKSYRFGFEYLLGLLSQLRAKSDRAAVASVLGQVDPNLIWNTLLSTLASVLRYTDEAYEDAGRPAGPEGFQRYRDHPKLGPFIRVMEYLREYCETVAIVTTNYDLISDKVIGIVHDTLNGHTDIGVSVTDMRRLQPGIPVRSVWTRVSGNNCQFCPSSHDWDDDWLNRNKGILVLKIHGSLNWVYCKKCNEVDIAKTKDDLPYIQDVNLRTKCPKCNKKYSWVIIPPVPDKPIDDHPVISRIWAKATSVFEEADRVVFVGYSLPEADPLVAQMLLSSRAVGLRARGKPWDYVIFETNKKVHERYEMLFGPPSIQTQYDEFEILDFEQNWLHRVAS